LLLLPPAEGLKRRGLDHRGLALAFSAEPELAALVAGDAAIEEVGEADFQADVPAAPAEPLANLPPGAPAQGRRGETGPAGARRRVGAMLVLAVLLVGWLLIVRPLADALDAAKMRHGEAAVALAQARARAQPLATSAPAAAGPADAIVARTAAAAGFPGARI